MQNAWISIQKKCVVECIYVSEVLNVRAAAYNREIIPSHIKVGKDNEAGRERLPLYKHLVAQKTYRIREEINCMNQIKRRYLNL